MDEATTLATTALLTGILSVSLKSALMVQNHSYEQFALLQ
jgi:hypothetical protein